MPLKKLILGFAFIVAITPFVYAHGQTIDGSTEQQPILFQALPQNPGPNTIVKFSVTSYLSDLNSASISWYVNGAKQASGTGLRSFSASTGAIGNTLTVRVYITTREGDTIDQSRTFRPGNVDLLWETDSYVPPFYQGKALPGIESKMRIIAIPRFGDSASRNYIFTWQKNGQTDSEQSGYGKSSFVFTTSSLGNSSTISVSISSSDGSLSAQNSVVIKPNKTKLLVYQYKPAYGTIYSSAIASVINLDSNEMSFSAVPYFAAISSQTPQYSWTMNGKILSDETNSILTLRNDTGAKGNSTISATISAGRNRSAAQEFLVTY